MKKIRFAIKKYLHIQTFIFMTRFIIFLIQYEMNRQHCFLWSRCGFPANNASFNVVTYYLWTVDEA
jgi:hypothetical protein